MQFSGRQEKIVRSLSIGKRLKTMARLNQAGVLAGRQRFF